MTVKNATAVGIAAVVPSWFFLYSGVSSLGVFNTVEMKLVGWQRRLGDLAHDESTNAPFELTIEVEREAEGTPHVESTIFSGSIAKALGTSLLVVLSAILRRDLYQCPRVFRTQIADRLGRLLDPHPTAPTFVHFPLLDAPAPAPLPLTHYRKQVYISVWCNLPSVASTGPIFKCYKIETFVTSTSWCNGRQRCSI
jgi:hypothetical protein